MNYPLVKQIPYQSPLSLFAIFQEEEGAVFLESAQLREFSGRYSFIAVDPFLKLVSKNGEVSFDGVTKTADPFVTLKQALATFPLDFHPHLPPFQGGVAGFFSYDLYQHLEAVPKPQTDDMQFPDMAIGFYDLVIAFDHELKSAWIFSSGYPLQAELERLMRAEQRLAWLQFQLKKAEHINDTDAEIDPVTINANFSEKTYQTAVNTVKDYIAAGDIFEANLSQRFKTALPKGLTTFDLYQRLRLINPAPFAAFVRLGETTLVSASPERFLKLSQRKIEARPIKGTCARGRAPEEDAQLAQALLQSEKDRAENIMIVDLLRNDLSRVSLDFSVKVPVLCGLESYATVHHLVSVVTSELHPQYDAIDLLRVTFPGGSITGAPKIRAMEIIQALEPTARGPYCGSIGYIGFNGDMDCSITIRTFAIKNKIVTFQAGGAVVIDSDSQAEYEETLVKANTLKTALNSTCAFT